MVKYAWEMRFKFVSLLALTLLATACGSSSSSGSADFDVSNLVVEAGSTASGSVEVDGTTIDYATSVPEGFEVGDTAPVLLALPPGPQDISLTRNIVDNVYAPEAQRLGWVVVSPAAPDGVRFFDGSEALLPGFVDWIEAWVTPEGGAPHVAGISNGGLSAFRYAAENPDRTQSVIAFPGFPRNSNDRAALGELADIPIRLYVGETDTNWVGPSEQTVTEFRALDGDIELTIFPGEGHVMQSTADGTLVFAELESFR